MHIYPILSNQLLYTTSSPTFVGLTLSTHVDNALLYSNTSGVVSESANLTFDGTTLAASAITVDNLSLDGSTLNCTSGDLTITAAGGDISFGNENLGTTGRIWAGADSSLDTSSIIKITENYLNTAAVNKYGLFSVVGSYPITGAQTGEVVGIRASAYFGGTTASAGGYMIGFRSLAYQYSDVTIGAIWGNVNEVGIYGGKTGTISSGVASRSFVYASSGVITNGYNFYGAAPTKTTGSIGTFYGVYLEEATVAGTNWQFYSVGGDSYFGDCLLSTDTTNGLQICTATSQKLAFYGATRIVQPTTAVAEASFTENAGGTAVNVDSTFGGYTLQQVVKALQNLGLLA